MWVIKENMSLADTADVRANERADKLASRACINGTLKKGRSERLRMIYDNVRIKK